LRFKISCNNEKCFKLDFLMFLDFSSIPSYFSCAEFILELIFISKKLYRWVPPVRLLHPRWGPPVGALKPCHCHPPRCCLVQLPRARTRVKGRRGRSRELPRYPSVAFRRRPKLCPSAVTGSPGKKSSPCAAPSCPLSRAACRPFLCSGRCRSPPPSPPT
jgi:hypothetical protein